MIHKYVQSKVRTAHLERKIALYIRQSSIMQVRENTGSTARQYDLRLRALDLGWSEEQIVIIDQDQGRSGTSAEERSGFTSMLADIALGRIGAIISLEASRLSRDCEDWHHLIKLCALMDTLIIDESNVYDPNDRNDRLTLGLKGTLSETEILIMMDRLHGGKITKAMNGELYILPPVGYVRDPITKKLVLDPNELVREAVQLIFDVFEQQGSAGAVVRHFAANNIYFPHLIHKGAPEQGFNLVSLSRSRVLTILHNPRYTGAFVYGRRELQVRVSGERGSRVKRRLVEKERAEWTVVKHNVYEGYITWEQFLRNQEKLDANINAPGEDHRGASRSGAALLTGVAQCGKCNRRMYVEYNRDARYRSYSCTYIRNHYAGKRCQSIPGACVDKAVEKILLEAIKPAELEISLSALEQVEAQIKQIEAQRERQIKLARYEAEQAERRFKMVDACNRLVASELEKQWNQKLREVKRLEQEWEASPKQPFKQLGAVEREAILGLAQDFPKIWYADTVSPTERKQLLRLLIADVMLNRSGNDIHLTIKWQTGASTERVITYQRPGYNHTDSEVTDLIREYAPTRTDRQIAEMLNEKGLKSKKGLPFTKNIVLELRKKRAIPTGCPELPRGCFMDQRGDNLYTAKAASNFLNIHPGTVVDWWKNGILEGVQSSPRSPLWVKLSAQVITKLRKPVKRRIQRRRQSDQSVAESAMYQTH